MGRRSDKQIKWYTSILPWFILLVFKSLSLHTAVISSSNKVYIHSKLKHWNLQYVSGLCAYHQETLLNYVYNTVSCNIKYVSGLKS
jgi:hypothetical protein